MQRALWGTFAMSPEQALEIVCDYGALLSEPSALGIVRDIRSLPHPKEGIKAALLTLLPLTEDAQMREHLRSGYVLLADFQPLTDGEVRALQTWQMALTESPQKMVKLVGQSSDAALAVQARIAHDAAVLLTELKVAGF